MLLSTGGFGAFILTGEVRRGMSKNEGVFRVARDNSGEVARPSISIRSGWFSPLWGFVFGEGGS
jgi:hypothetical protein